MTDSKNPEESAAFWRQKVEAWQGSGLSQSQFCKTQDLNYHRFVYWRRKFDRSQSRPDGESAGFAAVARRPEVDAGLTLSLPNGLVLRGISTANVSLVRQLLDCL